MPKSKSKRVKLKNAKGKGNGPKYKRYFFALSDKMILDMLGTSTFLIQSYVGEDSFDEILSLKDEIIALEFPETKGDTKGVYGALVIPTKHLYTFLDKGPKHLDRKIQPRELNPSVSDMVYLSDFNPNHKSIGFRLIDYSHVYEGSKIIPFRLPSSGNSIDNRLIEAGYLRAISFTYVNHNFSEDFQGALESDKESRIFNFYSDSEFVYNSRIHIHNCGASKNDEDSICSRIINYNKKPIIPDIPMYRSC